MTALERLMTVARSLRADQLEALTEIAGRMAAADDRAIGLLSVALSLHPDQVEKLLRMAQAMTVRVEQQINPTSDLVTPAFASSFADRLRIYHGTQTERFNKKSFEYAFIEASEAAGRTASITTSQTAPGADVTVEGVNFSLKTEAATSIRSDKITISKFMEARWIRDCRTGDDFARELVRRFLTHLSHYQRILTLRSFPAGPSKVRYDLVEIPHRLLSRVSELRPNSFAARTANNSSRADIHDAPVGSARPGDPIAFTVRIDGSVEKITIAGLRTDLCVLHASWLVTLGGQ